MNAVADAGADEHRLFPAPTDRSVGVRHSLPFDTTPLEASARDAETRVCLAALGSPQTILASTLPCGELKRFALDNVSAFLLSQIDGATSVEAILDVACMPPLFALRHLRSLVERGMVVAVAPPSPGRAARGGP